jgi:hypothetical protein
MTPFAFRTIWITAAWATITLFASRSCWYNHRCCISCSVPDSRNISQFANREFSSKPRNHYTHQLSKEYLNIRLTIKALKFAALLQESIFGLFLYMWLQFKFHRTFVVGILCAYVKDDVLIDTAAAIILFVNSVVN